MDDVWGDFLGSPNGTTPAAVITNQSKKVRSFKSKENTHKNEDGPDCTKECDSEIPHILALIFNESLPQGTVPVYCRQTK